MIRCAWCGAENYAIDSWCASCSRHLDWAPPAKAAVLMPPPPPQALTTPSPSPVVMDSPISDRTTQRRRRVVLAPAVAVVALAMVLALPVAIRFAAAGRSELPSLPNTAIRPAAPAAPASSTAPTAPVPTPDATPTPDAAAAPAENGTQPVAPVQPVPTTEAPPAAAPQPAAGDPTAAIARFYQDVSGHDFAAAAALWSAGMQARYPPAVYIDHRFAATQQINLQAARIVGSRGGQAVVYVRVVEVLDGQTRHWVGTWQLVNTESGWLLDRPNLRSET